MYYLHLVKTQNPEEDILGNSIGGRSINEFVFTFDSI